MLRIVVNSFCKRSLRSTTCSSFGYLKTVKSTEFIKLPNSHQFITQTRNYNVFQPIKYANYPVSNLNLLNNPKIIDISNKIVARSVTKFSLKKGKRKSVKAALRRFFRLHWGGWIRTRAGRHKRLWKKSPALRKRLREHVFVNATQATLLDKMVTKYWKRPKYYVDDPYAPYHSREEFINTRRKPLP